MMIMNLLAVVTPPYIYQYAAALTKKWCYWPKGVPGDFIDAQFEDKEVGDVGMKEERN